MPDRGFNIFELFSLITPHQKHSALNAALPAHGDCLLYLFDLYATINRIEDALRSALGTDPDAKATQLGKQIKHFGVEAIGARDALERDAQAARAHLSRILANPLVVNGEHIVGNPYNVRGVGVHEPFHFIDHQQGIAATVGLSKDLVTAPAALIRAAARSDEVD